MVDGKWDIKASPVDTLGHDYETDPAVNNLRAYLRIRTVHPNVNYDECITYLRGQAAQLGLPVQVTEVLPGKPVLVMTWEGTEPALPSVLLNSHMDVVPVFEKSWKYPPFEAHMEDGVIYARGIQDMKSVGIQYIEAVRRLKSQGIRLKRTLHLSFVPDEEIGGGAGMADFVQTEHFKRLNIGCALDEGVASPTDDYIIYNAERTIWHLKVICPGLSGHGSLLLPDNPGVKVRYIIDKFMDLRAESIKKLAENPELTIGDVTSVNLTMLSGGIQNNVIPENFAANFDIRIATSVNIQEFENMVKTWCQNAGSGVYYEFDQKDPYVLPTKVDNTNPFWIALKNTFDTRGLPMQVRTFPGGTDSRYLRELNIPSFGFSPMRRVEPTLHQHNERLRADVFLNGIQLYEAVIPAVANA